MEWKSMISVINCH